MTNEGLKLKRAVARYGLSEYPLSGFPLEYDWEQIWAKLLEYFGSDPRLGGVQVTVQPPIPEMGMDREVAVHLPDWSIEIRYKRAGQEG